MTEPHPRTMTRAELVGVGTFFIGMAVLVMGAALGWLR